MDWWNNVAVGDRFHDARMTAFGAPSRDVWVVDRVWFSLDDLQYASLVNQTFPDRKKTIATAALADRNLYVPASVKNMRRRITDVLHHRMHRFQQFYRAAKFSG